MKIIRVALLISGEGTTAEAVIRAFQTKRLRRVEPVVVISSTANAGGILKAKMLGIPTQAVDRSSFGSLELFGEKLLDILRLYHVDVVSQNGWLPLTPTNVIKRYQGNIINQHPGPLDAGRPDFGGKGMYGKRVTCARIAYAWMAGHDYWTEATTHHVTGQFDQGPVISRVRMVIPKPQSRVPYSWFGSHRQTIIRTTHDTSARLLTKEHANVIATLQMFGSGIKLPEITRRAPLVSSKTIGILTRAKRLAIDIFPNG